MFSCDWVLVSEVLLLLLISRHDLSPDDFCCSCIFLRLTENLFQSLISSANFLSQKSTYDAQHVLAHSISAYLKFFLKAVRLGILISMNDLLSLDFLE